MRYLKPWHGAGSEITSSSEAHSHENLRVDVALTRTTPDTRVVQISNIDNFLFRDIGQEVDSIKFRFCDSLLS